MDFGWAAKAFWILCVVAVIASAWYAKRLREKPAKTPDNPVASPPDA